MADLLGNDIGLNYKGLLNLDTTINTGLDGTLRVVTDGEGDSSPLYLSQTAIGLGTTSIWDNTNGRLGIGTTSPLKPLHVIGGIALTAGSANDTIESGGVNSVLIKAGGSNGLTINSQLVTLGAWNGTQSLYAASGGSGNSNRTGIDLVIGSGQSTGNGNGGSLLFQYTPIGISGTQANPYSTAMAISGANGNIGIGTTSPSSLLHLEGATTTTLTISSSTNTSYSAINFKQGATDKAYVEFINSNHSDTSRRDFLELFNTTSTGGVSIWTNALQRVMIDSAGLVGINKSASLAAQLDVVAASATVGLSVLGATQATSGTIGTFLSTQTSNATSGTLASNSFVGTFAAAAGSANFRPISATYTINNSGAQSGTATGIFLNATETALNSMTHNLMDLQVGGVSKFSVSKTGVVAANYFQANAYNQFYWAGRSMLSSFADGNILIQNNAAIDFNLLQFGGTSSSYPALKRSTTNLQVRLADDSGYAPIDASLYKVAGVSGFTGTGIFTSFTIEGGIITAAS